MNIKSVTECSTLFGTFGGVDAFFEEFEPSGKDEQLQEESEK
ncbi:hypothetical protein [Metabacillus sp. RGM 3146]